MMTVSSKEGTLPQKKPRLFFRAPSSCDSLKWMSFPNILRISQFGDSESSSNPNLLQVDYGGCLLLKQIEINQ